MAVELSEGKTYLVKATTTNMSTKAGVPVAALLTINIAAVVNSQVIMGDSATYGFAAEEAHTFEFPMAVPMGTGGKAGAVVAEVLDPNGNKLADGSLDVVIIGLIGCTFTVINCPSAGAGYVAMFWTPTGAWVPCGGIGTIPLDMDEYRPWFLFIDFDRFSIVDGRWGGDIAMYEEWVYNMYNGKHYEFDWATKILREVG